ncbi:MAG TPA: IS1595 family transposase, partial [Crocinitomix sp.]|nr:IS1595 family transposase [Crocinitomix sp.]
ISNFVEVHIMEKLSKKTTVTTLRWVHIAISNAKRTLLVIYHKIKGKYLQLYLDEFCYKLNRKDFKDNLFDRLTFAVAKSYWYNCS